MKRTAGVKRSRWRWNKVRTQFFSQKEAQSETYFKVFTFTVAHPAYSTSQRMNESTTKIKCATACLV